MSKLRIAFDLFTMATSGSALFFMAIVFFTESFFGRGITYVEPNIPMALFELTVTILGIIAVFIQFGLRVLQRGYQ